MHLPILAVREASKYYTLKPNGIFPVLMRQSTQPQPKGWPTKVDHHNQEVAPTVYSAIRKVPGRTYNFPVRFLASRPTVLLYTNVNTNQGGQNTPMLEYDKI